MAKDFPSILSNHVAGRQARLIVDTSGSALHHLVTTPHDRLHTLRMDDVEAEELAGRSLPDVTDTAAFASDLVTRGVARMVIVARGADGSVLTSAEGAWHAVAAPTTPVVSKVGAGDSFVGGFTLALAEGRAPGDCLRFGVAAAAAAVTTEATRLCDPDTTRRLYDACRLTAL